MKNKIKKILIFVAVLTVALSLVIGSGLLSHANDYNDFDSDFGDFGGSDFGGSDFGGDYGGDGVYIFDGNGSGGGSFLGVVVIVVIIVIVIVILNKKKQGGGGATPVVNMGDSSCVDVESLEKLRSEDPDFSEANTLAWCENLFTTMQLAWSDQDYEKVRPFLGNALFEEHSKELEAKKARREKNCRSEIAVLQKKLESYSSDGHNEYLNVWMRIKMKDMLVRSDNPNEVIHPAKTFYMDFRWQLVRAAGAKTDTAADGMKTGTCPHCGAPVNMNQSGKCEYCGSVITAENGNWVLSKIDALQQRSV